MSHQAFSSWAVTTALYNNLHSTAAARGELYSPDTPETNDLPTSATIPLIFIFYFFYDIAYTPLLVSYTLEILPYRIRAKGFAVMVREDTQRCGYVPS